MLKASSSCLLQRQRLQKRHLPASCELLLPSTRDKVVSVNLFLLVFLPQAVLVAIGIQAGIMRSGLWRNLRHYAMQTCEPYVLA